MPTIRLRLPGPLLLNCKHLSAHNPHPDQRDAKKDALGEARETHLAQPIEREEGDDDWQR